MLSLKLTGISLVVFWHFFLTILEMRGREKELGVVEGFWSCRCYWGSS